MNETNLSEKLIAVFISTHETLNAEKFLREENLPFRPVIKPRGISSNCQMGLQFALKDLKALFKIVERNSLALSGVYEKNLTSWTKMEI